MGVRVPTVYCVRSMVYASRAQGGRSRVSRLTPPDIGYKHHHLPCPGVRGKAQRAELELERVQAENAVLREWNQALVAAARARVEG